MTTVDSKSKLNCAVHLSDFVDSERLWQRHIELGKIGATESGGVNRQALTEQDSQARRLVMEWAVALGAKPRMDAVGNLFLRFPGTDPGLPPIATGSHLDTQPSGGMFDGIYGVLAGLEVLEALAASDRRLPCPLDLVIWMNEEGSRFGPATMGSGVYAGLLELEDILLLTDADGVVLGDALAVMKSSLDNVEFEDAPCIYNAYFEAHIEQGPVLEESETQIGAVSGIQGLRQYEVIVSGQSAHAGTTPRSRRRDALVAAMALISDITVAINDDEDLVRFTVGRFEVRPGSPNTIPSEVLFSIDLRHPDDNRLEEIERLIAQCVKRVQNCRVDFRCLIRSAVTRFDQALVASIEHAAEVLEFSVKTLPSGATHDAKSMATLCPTAMIFVPCRDGVSHHESEWAEAEHLWAGACVLADVIEARSNLQYSETDS
jgi:N-carbamoyl-L-amino-acid hydrolase